MASAGCSEENEECTRRVFEAVNKNSVCCLKSARNTYSQIQLLTSLAECNEDGDTPMVIAIKSNYVYAVEDIMRFLQNVLDHNIEENQLKLTFVINQFLHQIPVKQLIDILIYDQYQCQKSKWLMFVAKIFIKSISLTRQDKIMLLEVIGTALIIQLNCYEITEENALCVNYGLECWREAMTLRYFPTDGGVLLPKLPNVCVPSVISSFIFGSAVEVATMEELDLLQRELDVSQENFGDDFDRFEHNNWVDSFVKRMVIQALLVIRRISFHEHLWHPHWFYFQILLDFAPLWNFSVKTYLFILEELNGFDPNLFPFRLFHVFIRTLDLVSDKFVEQLREPPNSPSGRELNYANLLIITKLTTSIQRRNHPHFRSFLCILCSQQVVYRLVYVLNSISSRMTSEEQHKLETFYCDYFRDFPERMTTVLHYAMSYNICKSTDKTTELRLQTIKRILKFGADPNAIDENGQTPLHRLATVAQFTDEDDSWDESVDDSWDESVDDSWDESVPAFFQILLDAGAHLDAVADNGKTVLCILKKKLEGKVHPYYESLINSVFPLSCFCARVIRRHGIPFEDRLPPRLKKLVSIHSAKGSIDLHQPCPGGCYSNST